MGRPRKDDPSRPTEDARTIPTKAEQRFLDLYRENGNVTQAAINSGLYRPKNGRILLPNAARAGSYVLKKFGPEIGEILDALDLSLHQLGKVVAEGCNAEQTFLVRGKDKSTLQKAPDWRARAKFAELALKVRNAFPATNVKVGVAGDPDGAPILVQHFDAIKDLPAAEKKKRLDEMMAQARRGPVRVAG